MVWGAVFSYAYITFIFLGSGNNTTPYARGEHT